MVWTGDNRICKVLRSVQASPDGDLNCQGHIKKLPCLEDFQKSFKGEKDFNTRKRQLSLEATVPGLIQRG